MVKSFFHPKQTVTKLGNQCSEFLVLESETLHFRMIVSVEERKPGAQNTIWRMADSMADRFVPSWPIIVNKSLEESDLHRLLGRSHKVRGEQNPKETNLVRYFVF